MVKVVRIQYITAVSSMNQNESNNDSSPQPASHLERERVRLSSSLLSELFGERSGIVRHTFLLVALFDEDELSGTIHPGIKHIAAANASIDKLVDDHARGSISESQLREDLVGVRTRLVEALYAYRHSGFAADVIEALTSTVGSKRQR